MRTFFCVLSCTCLAFMLLSMCVIGAGLIWFKYAEQPEPWQGAKEQVEKLFVVVGAVCIALLTIAIGNVLRVLCEPAQKQE